MYLESGACEEVNVFNWIYFFYSFPSHSCTIDQSDWKADSFGGYMAYHPL